MSTNNDRLLNRQDVQDILRGAGLHVDAVEWPEPDSEERDQQYWSVAAVQGMIRSRTGMRMSISTETATYR
jgi:hypothetical protein